MVWTFVFVSLCVYVLCAACVCLCGGVSETESFSKIVSFLSRPRLMSTLKDPMEATHRGSWVHLCRLFRGGSLILIPLALEKLLRLLWILTTTVLESYWWELDGSIVSCNCCFIQQVLSALGIEIASDFRSGKSSIQKVVFHKMSPHETLFLESTNEVRNRGDAIKPCQFIWLIFFLSFSFW